MLDKKDYNSSHMSDKQSCEFSPPLDFADCTIDDLTPEEQQRAFADALEGKNPLKGYFKFRGRTYSINKWWGYEHENGVVTISQQDPRFARSAFFGVKRIVGPFEEDLADELEGNQRMVRRRIMAAIKDKPLDVESEP